MDARQHRHQREDGEISSRSNFASEILVYCELQPHCEFLVGDFMLLKYSLYLLLFLCTEIKLGTKVRFL